MTHYTVQFNCAITELQ